MDATRVGWVVVGSAILCAGMTLVGVNAFAGRLWLVVVGFALFVGGYRTMQYGVHGWPSLDGLGATNASTAGSLARGTGLALSVVLCAYGFVLMGEAVRASAWQPTLFSGASVVVGYVIGHIAANGEVL
ncbi:hypothetical protein [Haloplanus aerogenes]|uniref:Uncharacterized protein n=1 Tax=Haloplanus aerogenes TaxID=660522 RepID=A0A3M0DU92_9EURY|nr:hypothetical protein [Haloplanus aerogenes]AZH25793.1 hypothetical protein DU502_10565 [Haloplanus aerogenes]RMB25531.1 hypothetical protein ATH50_0628 [Haloplanus aerogenes]